MYQLSECQVSISMFNLLQSHEHLDDGSRAAPILVSVSVSGQYQHFLAVSESVKYVPQVPILLLGYYTYY